MTLLDELGWNDDDRVIRWCVRFALACYGVALLCLLAMVVGLVMVAFQ